MAAVAWFSHFLGNNKNKEDLDSFSRGKKNKLNQENLEESQKVEYKFNIPLLPPEHSLINFLEYLEGGYTFLKTFEERISKDIPLELRHTINSTKIVKTFINLLQERLGVRNSESFQGFKEKFKED